MTSAGTPNLSLWEEIVVRAASLARHGDVREDIERTKLRLPRGQRSLKKEIHIDQKVLLELALFFFGHACNAQTSIEFHRCLHKSL
jgi:hypothetical protein